MHCYRICYLTYKIANHVRHKMAELKGYTKAFVNCQELIYCIKPASKNFYMLNCMEVYSSLFINFI